MQSFASLSRWLAALACFVLLAPAPALGQAYPNKAVRIVVPAAAGGNLDLITRAIAQKMAEDLGQPVAVENRPGASLLIGTRYVAAAAPDGYTILAVANTTVTAPSIVANAGYDPVKDFAGIGLTAMVPMVLVAEAKAPVKTVQDLIRLAKTRPDAVSFATSGGGSTGHIAAELFFAQAGFRALLVPYKGNSAALTDVAGGRVGYMFDQVTTSLPFIRSGRLKLIAVAGTTRSPLFPDTPTVAESGLPGYETDTFNGLVAPAGTPRPIINRLHEAVTKAVANPDLRKTYSVQGVELLTNRTPEEFDAFIKRETERYAKLAKSANIKTE